MVSQAVFRRYAIGGDKGMILASRSALVPTAGGAPAGDGIGKEITVHIAKDLPLGRHFLIPQDSVDRTDGKTKPAIDAFFGVNVEHPPTFVDAVHRTRDGAIAILDIDTGLCDYVSHKFRLARSQGRFRQTMTNNSVLKKR
ncbi:hypothetical protein A6U86_12420 [Rhizobium sp. AC27/96]|nr:hypothetical protein A6U86_12420 [Rhizobium sp. AC27/96]